MGVEHLAQSDLSKEFKRLGYVKAKKSILSLKEIDNILCEYYPEVRSKYNKIEYYVLQSIMHDLNLSVRTSKTKPKVKVVEEHAIKQKGIKPLRKWLFQNGLIKTKHTSISEAMLSNILTFSFPELAKNGYEIDLNNLGQVLEDFKQNESGMIKPKFAIKPNKLAKLNVDVTSKEFLNTWEWKTLRYEVLLEQGAVCKCCGAKPSDGVTLCVDHIKPRRTHPQLALDKTNLQVLCNDCNMGKGSWDTTNWNE